MCVARFIEIPSFPLLIFFILKEFIYLILFHVPIMFFFEGEGVILDQYK